MIRYYREQQSLRSLGNGNYERVMQPASFKKMGYRPVKGGRWSIRKQVDTGYWRAWTNGLARQWSKRFYYWEDAFAWASFVARTYKRYPAIVAEAKVHVVWLRIRDHLNVRGLTERTVPEVLDELQHEIE